MVRRAARLAGEGIMAFVVDLHVHTREGSACASQSAEELIARAIEVGLDGVAVTDHNAIEGALKAQRLARRKPLKVFLGLEVSTAEIGDVLVYGLRDTTPEARVSMKRLSRLVEREGAVMYAAHPFRRHNSSALWAWLEEEGHDWRRMVELPDLLKPLHGIEVYNGGATPQENETASLFASRFGLAGIAGSDAHGRLRVGWCATEFARPLNGTAQLVDALRRRRFSVSRGRSEYESETERSHHLRKLSQLHGGELAAYVQEYLRRKQ
jgi:predicted metal-dependent phosphoesterase TrpH